MNCKINDNMMVYLAVIFISVILLFYLYDKKVNENYEFTHDDLVQMNKIFKQLDSTYVKQGKPLKHLKQDTNQDEKDEQEKKDLADQATSRYVVNIAVSNEAEEILGDVTKLPDNLFTYTFTQDELTNLKISNDKKNYVLGTLIQ
jgi:pyruvate carboxylase